MNIYTIGMSAFIVFLILLIIVYHFFGFIKFFNCGKYNLQFTSNVNYSSPHPVFDELLTREVPVKCNLRDFIEYKIKKN